jgi:hydroxymethylglutaryl-CoA lyase
MTTPSAGRVHIQEVAPRDGFQIEPRWVETADKIAFINAMSRTGVSKIEVSSFVSPKAVPMLRDAEEVFRAIERRPGVVYVALIPNARGAERAFAAKVDEFNFVMSASETHNRANMRMSTDQSLEALRGIMDLARGVSVSKHASLATSFGCPFEGAVPLERVLGFVARYLDLGITGITLADTTGMANPRQVAHTVEQFRSRFGDTPLTLHFHNTRGMGLANAVAAYEHGAVRFDAALGGLGGCPFAPGATGNVCTEDLVHMFEEMQVDTGTDLPALLELARRLPALVGHDVPGQVAKAGRTCDLHARPAGA